MGSRDDYKFLQIIDAIASINQKVNLIGIVVETGIAKLSKGTDFFVTMRIVDQSKPSPGISVNFFAETMDKLPQLLFCGDIIQLSNVMMRTHGLEVYALYNKKYSSFALFAGRRGKTYAPYQCSSKYHAREQDRKFIDGLRKWSVDHPQEISPEDILQLKDIRVGEHFNLVCKILHLAEVQKEDWVYAWDGTDTPANPIETRLEDEMEKPLPVKLEPFLSPREKLCTFPAVGTVLRIKISRGNERLGTSVLKVGSWIKFVNLKCEVHAGLWFANLMPFTRVCHLTDDDDVVVQRQRTYDQRVSATHVRIFVQGFPRPCSLTGTDYPRVPFVTLMDVLCHPEVTAKFKCVVRVVAMFPWEPVDFRSPEGIYRVRLTLEDPTARLHAFLYDEDAVKFFDGYHPVDVMTRRRNMLLGIGEHDDNMDASISARDPPWVRVCLKSYYVDENDVWGSRNYRIFSTRFRESGRTRRAKRTMKCVPAVAASSPRQN